MNNEALEAIREKITILMVDPKYRSDKSYLIDLFKGYDEMSPELQRESWHKFSDHIIKKWNRKLAYYFCFDISLNQLVDESVLEDFDEFSCTITGEGMVTDSWIRFANEPADNVELSDYIHSRKWLDDSFFFRGESPE
jgi:hypothetical protein